MGVDVSASGGFNYLEIPDKVVLCLRKNLIKVKIATRVSHHFRENYKQEAHGPHRSPE